MTQLLKSGILLLTGIAVGVGLAVAIPAGYSLLSGGANRDRDNDGWIPIESLIRHESPELSTSESDSTQSLDPKAIAELNSSFARRAALYALLADAGDEKLLTMLRNSFAISPSSRREEIQSAVIQKLALTDPEIAFREVQTISRLQQGPLLRSMFEEWSSSNLEYAIARAESLRGLHRNTALRAILESRDDLPEDKRLEIARQLGNVQLAISLITSEKIAKHAGSPKEKWDFILNDSVEDRDQLDTLLHIAGLWSDEIGLEVILQIHEEVRDDYWIYSTLIRSLTSHDPQEALDFLSGVELEQRELVGRVVVESWARTDPLAALNALESVEPPRLRKSFVDNLSYVWARTDPVHFVENVDVLGLAQRIRPLETAFGEIAQTSPEEALRQLERLANSIEDTSTVTRRIIYVWSEQDPQAAVDWILSNYTLEDPERSDLLPNALGKLSLEDPNKAMAIALEHPVLEDRTPPEYQIIWEMSWNADAESAVAMLARVRPNPRSESRSYAFSLVGTAFIRNDRPSEALKLAMQLSESERNEYYSYLTYAWAYENPLQLLENFDQLPSAQVKSMFASALVQANDTKPALTNEQIDKVKTYIQNESE